MKKKAVYAGSFDPPTLGHQWMIEEAAQMFDEVIVAVGINPDKKSTFSVDDRVKMLSSMTAHMGNVSVSSFQNQFLVKYVSSIDATFMIRGLRNVSDFIVELGMRNINADLGEGITTVLLMPPRELAEVSSSLVKGLVGPEGWELVVAKYVPPVVLRQMIGLKHKVWEHLVELGAVGDKYEFWESVLSHYMMPGRHYHDWRHIIEMLNMLSEVRHLANNPTAIETATLFHDRVYNVFRNDNELVSKDVMRMMCQHTGLPEEFADEVDGQIMATKHNPNFSPKTNDEKLLVDLDLTILGATTERFDEYEEGIRKEYAHVSDVDFAHGRSKILQGFLDRDRIFYTDYFHEKLGTRAEENLKRSIAKLQRSL